MKKIVFLSVLLCFLSACGSVDFSHDSTKGQAGGSSMSGHVEEKHLEAFPKAEAGMQRFVILLAHKTRLEEGDYTVELQVGKNAVTDGVNRYFGGSEIKQQNLEGWGYTYYTVDTGSMENMASTRMGVPSKAKPVTKFVSFGRKMIAYNSRLPVVVYAPEGAEIRYRVLSALSGFKYAEKR